MQILLVENNEDVIRMLICGLGNKYILKTCKTLAECLSLLVTPPMPDVIILDLQLSDTTGLNAIAVLQQTHPEVPIVVMTGTMTAEDAEQAIEMGAQEFLTKPIDLVSIERAVRNAVARHRVRGEYKLIKKSLQELKDVQAISGEHSFIKTSS